MNKIDYRSVDGQLLLTFLLVLEETSATRAAERMGVSQSSVSHALARLRTFFGDPLFIRAGQKLQPTERAVQLRAPVQAALDSLQALTYQRPFDPGAEPPFFIVAANDMQRELIFPTLIRDLDAEGVSASFEFIPSGHPTPSMMREARCHLALTPFPPDATDIVQTQLFQGRMMCFFDGSVRSAPKSWDEYCNAEHITVRFPDGGTSQRALTGVDKSAIRPARISVPNFGAILAFIKGARLVATEMDAMKVCTLQELDMAPLPLESDPVNIYMSWHLRSDSDPSHIWLRSRIKEIVRRVLAKAA